MICVGAALGFTIMVTSVSSLVRMILDTRLQEGVFDMWKTYRGFFFGTLLSPTFFLIYIPALICAFVAVQRSSLRES